MTFDKVRTRFPPSPTGDLHVGGARVALYNYLFARHFNGQLVLRIEDTDRERSTEQSVQAIFQGMEWLGLDYDEGPYYQTKRFERYKEVIQQLLDAGLAYRCYCSKQRLEALRADQMQSNQKPRYDGYCRDKSLLASDDKPYVIRFKNPTEGVVVIDDLIRGSITISNEELDDLIIARSDGTPTYNLTVVVDDWDMAISHVIRGDDHINNTPRQINLLKALGAPIPQYAHLPMILGADGKRLSKRHGAQNVIDFKAQGYLPAALLNYLVRLGWSHGDQEIFSLAEMEQLFGLAAVNRSPAMFDVEKLDWINQHYLKTVDVTSLIQPLTEQFLAIGIDISQHQQPVIADVIEVQRSRVKTLRELAAHSVYFYEDNIEYDAKAVKHLSKTCVEPLQEILRRLSDLASWDELSLSPVVSEVAQQFEIKMGKIAQPLRVALTGGVVSPPINVTLWLLGRDKAMLRIKNALEFIVLQNAVDQ